MQKNSLYFPNLNGLRFIAAFLVVIHHIEQNKSIFNLPNYWDVPAINLMGKLGVVLFFVLSGYLITYLLLKEKAETNTIHIKNFYIRRMLRIWPLYYLIVILGLFVIPHIRFLDMGAWTAEIQHHFEIKALLFILFLPNLTLTFFPRVPYAAQSWSIGVEEQFYLIWPFLLKKIKKVHHMLIGVIVFYIVIKLSLILLVHLYPKNDIIFKLYNFWFYFFTIDCMAFGGLAAYIKFKNFEKILRFLFNKNFQLLIYVTTLTLLIVGMRFPNVTYEVYAIFFSMIIINLASNKESIVNIEFTWLNYLGKISYGIYMYHILMSSLAIKLCLHFNIHNNFMFYALSIVFTIIVSTISYEFFEKRFIKAKIKYSTVVSGDNVKSEHNKRVVKKLPVDKIVLPKPQKDVVI